MTSLLVRALDAGEPLDATEERILDAALAEIAASGETTMDDIARRADVGRMTVFRRFGSKDALLDRLILRELRAFLADVDRRLAAVDDPGERVVEAFLACLDAGAGHPLMGRVTMEALASGEPSPLEVGRAFVAARLRAQDVDDADAAADVLVRLAASYVLFPAPDLDARAFAERTLAPIVGRRCSGPSPSSSPR